MQRQSDRPALSRQSLLTIVMLAVLLISVGGAWLLARGRGAMARTAVEIIRQIRGDGLARHWDPQTVRWYLDRRDGRAGAWRLLLRARRQGGGFEGLTFIVRQSHPNRRVTWAYWSLNADATSGTYFARTLSGQHLGRGWAHVIDSKTIVALADGQITIRQDIGPEPFLSQADTPPAYLPEGALALAQALVARRKAKAVFKITQDSKPPAGRRPRFVPVTMRYEGSGAAGGAASAVTRRIRGQKDPDMLYLDERGIPVRIESAGWVEQAVDRQQAQAAFADTADAEFILQLLRGHTEPVALVRRLLGGRDDPR